MAKLRSPIEFETTFQKYIADELIGEGGAGRVFAARDEAGAAVAIKVLNSALATTDKRRRFQNEIGFLLKTSHPNLVEVRDHGLSTEPKAPGPFYVMPRYVGSLRDRMETGLAAAEVLPLFDLMLRGVEAAHLLGAVHRDLKPENILLSGPGGLVVADFGIARFLPGVQAAPVKTSKAARMANDRYAAPEQRDRRDAADARADIFALGLMLNELFTNTVPYGVGFQRVATVAPDYAFVDAIVDSMIQQRADSRPANVQAVRSALLAESNLFSIRQRVNAERRAVVPEDSGEDEFILRPVEIVGVDWQEGMLTIQLSRPIDSEWVMALRNMGNFRAMMGRRPEDFRLAGSKASVAVDGHNAQEVINIFKEWLPSAAQAYKRRRGEIAARQRYDDEQARTQAKEKEAQRLQVLERLKY